MLYLESSSLVVSLLEAVIAFKIKIAKVLNTVIVT